MLWIFHILGRRRRRGLGWASSFGGSKRYLDREPTFIVSGLNHAVYGLLCFSLLKVAFTLPNSNSTATSYLIDKTERVRQHIHTDWTTTHLNSRQNSASCIFFAVQQNAKQMHACVCARVCVCVCVCGHMLGTFNGNGTGLHQHSYGALDHVDWPFLASKNFRIGLFWVEVMTFFRQLSFCHNGGYGIS